MIIEILYIILLSIIIIPLIRINYEQAEAERLRQIREDHSIPGIFIKKKVRKLWQS